MDIYEKERQTYIGYMIRLYFPFDMILPYRQTDGPNELYMRCPYVSRVFTKVSYIYL